jgi:hypothetical protein
VLRSSPPTTRDLGPPGVAVAAQLRLDGGAAGHRRAGQVGGEVHEDAAGRVVRMGGDGVRGEPRGDGPRPDLGEQPGLADAGLAGEPQQPAAPGGDLLTPALGEMRADRRGR